MSRPTTTTTHPTLINAPFQQGMSVASCRRGYGIDGVIFGGDWVRGIVEVRLTYSPDNHGFRFFKYRRSCKAWMSCTKSASGRWVFEQDPYTLCW